jgi:hypothetical protein
MDKDVLINRFERLRSQALGKLFTSAQGLGLALFMRKGMVSWAKAWTECTQKIKAPSTHNPDIKNHFSENINGQITMVLTNMIMDLNQKEIEYGFPSNSESDERAPAAQGLSLCTPILITADTYQPGEHQAPVCSPATSNAIGLAQRADCYN